jgi:hypothetical protein
MRDYSLEFDCLIQPSLDLMTQAIASDPILSLSSTFPCFVGPVYIFLQFLILAYIMLTARHSSVLAIWKDSIHKVWHRKNINIRVMS